MSVDARLFGDSDFIGVRASLIREVGAVEAVVLTRIHFRASESYRHAYEKDGTWWWRAPVPALAEETGLTEKQVRRSLSVLRDAGHLIGEQHQVDGRYDRALSFRVDLRPTGQMHTPHRADEDPPSRADVLSIEEEEDTTSADEEQFDLLWQAWPRKDGRKPAEKRWLSLSKAKRAEVQPLLLAHAAQHRKHTPPRFIPMLSTWLNQERWSDPLPVSQTDGARKAEETTAYTGKRVTPAGHRAVYDDMSGAFSHFEIIPAPGGDVPF